MAKVIEVIENVMKPLLSNGDAVRVNDLEA